MKYVTIAASRAGKAAASKAPAKKPQKRATPRTSVDKTASTTPTDGDEFAPKPERGNA